MKKIVDRKTFDSIMEVANAFHEGEEIKREFMMHSLKHQREQFINQISSSTMKKRD